MVLVSFSTKRKKQKNKLSCSDTHNTSHTHPNGWIVSTFVRIDKFINRLYSLINQTKKAFFLNLNVVTDNVGTVIENSTMRKFWCNTKRPNILNVTFAIRNYIQVQGYPYIACKCTRKPLTRCLTRFRIDRTLRLKSLAWTVCICVYFTFFSVRQQRWLRKVSKWRQDMLFAWLKHLSSFIHSFRYTSGRSKRPRTPKNWSKIGVRWRWTSPEEE